VRSEVARRKLDIRTDRVAALCECGLDVLIEANGGISEREEFREFHVVTGDSGGERRALDDARYLSLVTHLERACANR
jgi:carbonic anhydrase/acetyltransferase-like protein (isoleucine patch superfamily)